MGENPLYDGIGSPCHALDDTIVQWYAGRLLSMLKGSIERADAVHGVRFCSPGTRQDAERRQIFQGDNDEQDPDGSDFA